MATLDEIKAGQVATGEAISALSEAFVVMSDNIVEVSEKQDRETQLIQELRDLLAGSGDPEAEAKINEIFELQGQQNSQLVSVKDSALALKDALQSVEDREDSNLA